MCIQRRDLSTNQSPRENPTQKLDNGSGFRKLINATHLTARGVEWEDIMPGMIETSAISVLLLLIGLISILTKRFSLPTREVGGKPVFTLKVTGPRAIRFGRISLSVGIILLVLCLYTFIADDESLARSGIPPLIGIVAIVSVLSLFAIESLLEFLNKKV